MHCGEPSPFTLSTENNIPFPPNTREVPLPNPEPFGYDTYTLKLTILHGKNDRRAKKENFKVGWG